MTNDICLHLGLFEPSQLTVTVYAVVILGDYNSISISNFYGFCSIWHILFTKIKSHVQGNNVHCILKKQRERWEEGRLRTAITRGSAMDNRAGTNPWRWGKLGGEGPWRGATNGGEGMGEIGLTWDRDGGKRNDRIFRFRTVSRIAYGYDRGQIRVMYASREDRYYGDYYFDTEYSVDRFANRKNCYYEDSGQGSDRSKGYDTDNRMPRRSRKHLQKPCAVVAPSQQLQLVVVDNEKVTQTASSFKRFVTFYITNFPPQASEFFLRKNFELCDILEDLNVASNRN